ncbi:MAG: bacteriophage abortive infection AbiH family protein [Bacteroidales bacterium]|nr:bacteriophage abortive infection AbiH family protein [Bacteroidales bacterium]
MKNLIIIGNGLDKAHGLKTSYNEFIEDLFLKYFRNPTAYSTIMKSCPSSINDFGELLQYLRNYYKSGFVKGVDRVTPFHYAGEEIPTLRFKNRFIELLLTDMIDYNWCDIEFTYFEELMRYNNSSFDPKRLNDDFEDVKKHLSEYLLDEEKRAVKIDRYEHLFKFFADSPNPDRNTLILTFNYTRTIEKLYQDVIVSPIIYLHGRLEDEKNPMIFGYAANMDELDTLLSQNNNEFLKNIKRLLYKRTKNEKTLNKFLNPDRFGGPALEDVNVFILGHSCGLSDNLILGEIFNHESIHRIKIFYHETFDNYFDVQVNMDRISHTGFEKLVNFEESHRMPQWDDDENKTKNFLKHLENEQFRFWESPKNLFKN